MPFLTFRGFAIYRDMHSQNGVKKKKKQSHEPVHTRDQADFEGTSPCDLSHEFKPVIILGPISGPKLSPCDQILMKIGRSHGGT